MAVWTTTKPASAAVLNTAHPLASRLVRGYVFSEGTGQTTDLKSAAVTTTGSAVTWVTNAHGKSRRNASANGVIDLGVSASMPAPPFHVVVGMFNPTASETWANGGGAIFNNRAGSNWSPSTVNLSISHYNNLWNVEHQQANVNVPFPQTSLLNTNSSHHVHIYVGTTAINLWHNGTQLGPVGPLTFPTNSHQMTVGSTGAGTEWLVADYDYIYIFQGEITQQERDDLLAAPYSLAQDPVTILPTRFYLPSTGTAPISPAFDAAWDDTSSVTTRLMGTTRGTSSFVEVTDTEVSSSNQWDVCLGRFVSEPLAAQTISGNVMGIIRARENNAALNARSQMVIRVVSGDGATVRGTLLAQDNTTTNISEWVATTTVTAARNARFPVGSGPVALTPVAAQQGDRLVIEVGGRAVNTVTTSYTLGLRFGENAADLANNETGTTDGAPWIEFDSAIQFYTAPTAHTVSGIVAAAKPAVSGTSTQTFPARNLAATAAAKKPTTTAAATQTFPARSLTAAAAASKPTISATARSSRRVTTAAAAPKPTTAGSAVQTFPARNLTGAATTPKPSAASTAVQTFPARSLAATAAAAKPTASATARASALPTSAFSAGFTSGFGKPDAVFAVTTAGVAKKPTASATSTQIFPARAVIGSAAAKKPAAAITVIQEFPERYVEATIDAPKPAASAASTQIFPARSLTASAAASKPTVAAAANSSRTVTVSAAAQKPSVAATVVQAALGSLAVTATASAPKPNAAATAIQIFPARSLTGAAMASKPKASVTATQVYPARNLTAVVAAKKPAASGVVRQVFEERYVEGQVEAPKPHATAAVVQSTIGEVSVFGTATAPKPVAAGSAIQVITPRFIATAAAVTKPTATASVRSTRRVTVSADAPKPAATATAVQTYPTRSVSGAASVKKPMLSASATHPYPPHTVSGEVTAPKPTAVAVALAQVIPPRFLAGAASAPKPAILAFVEQMFPARDVEGIVLAVKPTASATVDQGPSPDAAHIATSVFLTGVIDYDVRMTATIDMDVALVAAINGDVALTGIIEH